MTHFIQNNRLNLSEPINLEFAATISAPSFINRDTVSHFSQQSCSGLPLTIKNAVMRLLGLIRKILCCVCTRPSSTIESRPSQSAQSNQEPITEPNNLINPTNEGSMQMNVSNAEQANQERPRPRGVSLLGLPCLLDDDQIVDGFAQREAERNRQREERYRQRLADSQGQVQNNLELNLPTDNATPQQQPTNLRGQYRQGLRQIIPFRRGQANQHIIVPEQQRI